MSLRWPERELTCREREADFEQNPATASEKIADEKALTATDGHHRHHDIAVLNMDYEGKPTDEELATLRRVPGKIPMVAFLLCAVEFCERASYYGKHPSTTFCSPCPGVGPPHQYHPETNSQSSSLAIGCAQIWTNYVNRPLPDGGNGYGAPPDSSGLQGALGLGQAVGVSSQTLRFESGNRRTRDE